MKTWVALLRAVNLGSRNKLAMSDLRELLEALGYEDVRTHLQSGNAVFQTSRGTAADLERAIARRIKRDVGLETTVMVWSAQQLATVVRDNPFLGRRVAAKQLQATFLASQPPAAKVRALDPAAYEPDEFAIGKRVIYVRLPKGFQGSRLPNWERVLGTAATTRSWQTVTRLLDLASGG